MKRSQARQQFFDDSGNVLNGGKLYYYEPDGAYSTQKTVYKNKAKTSSWTQPITLDTDGTPLGAEIYEDGDYDRKVFDSSDNLIRSEPNIGDNRSAVLTDLSENIVSNGSFETDTDSDGTPDNWSVTASTGTIARSTTYNYHGTAGMACTGCDTSDSFRSENLFEITEGKKVNLSFAYYASNASALPVVQLLWYDKDQAWISQTDFFRSNNGATATSWTYVEGLSESPPANARYAYVQFYPNYTATTYNTYFDDVRITQPNVSKPAGHKPYGLILSRDSGDTAHDINVTAGGVLDSTLSSDMILPSEITKRMDVAWAIGDDAGGHDGSSLPADGIWYVYLIKDSNEGVVDVIGSTSSSSPTLPSGWDLYRLIGCWRTDSSNNFVDGIHTGNRFEWFSPITEVNDSSLTNVTYETGTAALPPNSDMLYTVHLSNSSTSINYGFHIRHTSDNTNSRTFVLDTTNHDEVYITGSILLDDSSQFEYMARFDSGTVTMEVISNGCVMHTRDNP